MQLTNKKQGNMYGISIFKFDLCVWLQRLTQWNTGIVHNSCKMSPKIYPFYSDLRCLAIWLSPRRLVSFFHRYSFMLLWFVTHGKWGNIWKQYRISNPFHGLVFCALSVKLSYSWLSICSRTRFVTDLREHAFIKWSSHLFLSWKK